jgi:hypothetical protein
MYEIFVQTINVKNDSKDLIDSLTITLSLSKFIGRLL